jgi:hypothetical protein
MAFLAAGALLAVSVQAMPQSFSVKSVKVEHDGQWHAEPNGHQTPQQCTKFKLAGVAALKWFIRSKEVTQHEWLEELDWTQCSAEGTLLTNDGRTYHWELDQSGRGRVVVTPAVSVYLSGRNLYPN